MKFSLIDYDKLPSVAFSASASERRDDRLTSQNVYVAGKIVRSGKVLEHIARMFVAGHFGYNISF